MAISPVVQFDRGSDVLLPPDYHEARADSFYWTPEERSKSARRTHEWTIPQR